MTKKLINHAKALHEQLKLIVQTFKTKPKDSLNQATLSTYFELIQSLWDQIQKDHYTLLQKDSQDIEEYLKSDIFNQIQTLYIDTISEIRSGLEPQRKESLIPALDQSPRSELRLPKITIPKFDGSYKSWRSFHDLFTSIVHNDTYLSPVQKLHYLKTSVTGEAERLLHQFDITSDNYEKAWTFLAKRYHNPRVLINTQLNLLFNQPTVKNESALAIKNLLDQTEECLHELRCLNTPTETWDPIIIHFLTKKLPPESLSKWEQEHGEKTTLPTYQEFTKFLEKRFRTLEALQNCQPSSMPSTSQKPNKIPRVFFNEMSKCPKCNTDHPLYKCEEFRKMTASQRFTLINKANLCKNCLSANHSTIKCPSKVTCFKCQKRHHTLLHFDKTNTIRNSNQQINDDKNYQSLDKTNVKTEGPHSFFANNLTTALLSTALIKVITPSSKECTLRALIDSGSQISFITKSAVKKLNLKDHKIDLNITGLSKTQTAHVQSRVTLEIHSINSPYQIQLSALVLDTISDIIPSRKINISHLGHISHLKLADPTFANPGQIDLLLGADIYAKIITDGIIKGCETGITAQNTHLGWILFGQIQNNETRSTKVFTAQISSQPSLNDRLKQFWEQEEITQKIVHPDDQRCEQIYQSTHERLPNGRYQVQLPFQNPEGPELGQSRHIAYKQFLQLEKQLLKTPELYAQYKQCIHEYISLNHLTEVSSDQVIKEKQNAKCTNYYLPHHAVLKENSSTTKVRVVFNASAKTSNGMSLNEQLLVGPTIQPTLWATLLHWRCFKFAFTADIEKMYRMIQVHPKHQAYQRILWRDDPSETIKDYQLTTVTFGFTPAPYLAIRTLQQLAHDERKNHELAAQSLINNFYVDDLLAGAHDIPTGLELQRQLLSVTAKGGFNLRKWVANHPKFLKLIPEEHKEIQDIYKLPDHESIKTLGIQWHPKTDHFYFSIKIPQIEDQYTKRKILSETASLFDPLGWLAPSIVIAKIFLQRLWLQGLEWDEALPETLNKEWKQFRADLTNINKISIPRWINYSPSNKRCELHGFCDASMRAYAAVVYIKIIDNHGNITCSLLTSKTRVAPLKPISLPRLELCGAHLLAKLISEVQADIKIPNLTTIAWTDSKITLAWIHGEPSRWKTYVANRVTEIQQLVPPNAWQHVSSQDNPADCASRGLSPTKLIENSLWWSGPEWLKYHYWPPAPNTTYETEEEKQNVKNFTTNIEQNWLTKFSSFPKLIRIVAYCLRFIQNTRQKAKILSKSLSKKELDDAETKIFQVLQQAVFPAEYHNLKANKPVPHNSRLLCLQPFLDKDQIIRVGGRLINAPLTYNQKHPIIIPNNHHITQLIINYLHNITLHGGTQLVLNTLRNKYWLLNARNTIRHQIRHCITCFRNNPIPSKQRMGDLPAPRVNPALPFEHTGIDYAGPINIKASKIRNAKIIKGYFSIFICLATKAIHIEIVSDLSTQAFLAAFKRFISRRGLCSHIYSDCGTNFTGANKEITKAYKDTMRNISQEMTHELKSIQWHFNPPAAPHFGGLWESNVKLIKNHLKKTLHNTILTFEELYTITCQVEACVNSRPLSALSNDPFDYNILTPGHFLTGRNLLDLPEPHSQTNTNPTRRWHYIQQLIHLFWKTWKTHYLHNLQQRTKWKTTQKNIKKGDLVILMDNNTPKMSWPIGRIIHVQPGKDNLVRVVTVKTPHSTYTRPITKICKIPFEE